MRIEMPLSSAVIINVPPSLPRTVDEQFSNRSEISNDSDEVFAKWSLSDMYVLNLMNSTIFPPANAELDRVWRAFSRSLTVLLRDTTAG
jgi:hypothetical protein